MADWEKVKKGLECCKQSTEDAPFQMCGECPYNDESIFVQDCRAVLCEDTLEVMKLYDAKAPVFLANEGAYYCGICHFPLGVSGVNYCSHCGRSVKWG